MFPDVSVLQISTCLWSLGEIAMEPRRVWPPFPSSSQRSPGWKITKWLLLLRGNPAYPASKCLFSRWSQVLCTRCLPWSFKNQAIQNQCASGKIHMNEGTNLPYTFTGLFTARFIAWLVIHPKFARSCGMGISKYRGLATRTHTHIFATRVQTLYRLYGYTCTWTETLKGH